MKTHDPGLTAMTKLSTNYKFIAMTDAGHPPPHIAGIGLHTRCGTDGPPPQSNAQ